MGFSLKLPHLGCGSFFMNITEIDECIAKDVSADYKKRQQNKKNACP